MAIENKELQMIAMEKIREEMQYADQFLLQWNAYWLEKITYESLNVDSPSQESEHKDKTDQYFMIDEQQNVGANTITWHAITTNNATREISFHNTGRISLKKFSQKKCDPNYKSICYEANHSVLTNDFNINIILARCDSLRKLKYENYAISFSGNLITLNYQDKENNTNYLIKYKLDSELKVQQLSLEFPTYKANGKRNGLYRITINDDDNTITAIFLSRKGEKIDITESEEHFERIQDALFMEGFDIYDLNLKTILSIIKIIQGEITQIIKGIKGEIPLQGLSDSLENTLTLIDNPRELRPTSRILQQKK